MIAQWERGRKWLTFPSMAPHNLWTSRRKAEVQPLIDDGWKQPYNAVYITGGMQGLQNMMKQFQQGGGKGGGLGGMFG